ncbi:hypothetical protein Q5752_005379 [Cryptotrichosporon argae]
MPPSPGKIQPLPVKVLYTIDTAPQSFVSVLPERHDVYVHPSPLSDELAGSCTLLPIARGICFSSPECTPSSGLDFSLYSLDPSQSWTGKGFLSWLLAESSSPSSSTPSTPSSASTLIRGLITRAYEFAPTSFSENGLEGLVAAAQAGETDGKGWGLEVTVTLRQVNPEGKEEFSARGAFATMLATGKSSATGPLSVAPRLASSPVRPAPVPAQPAQPLQSAQAVRAGPSGPQPHSQTAPTIPQLSKPRPPYVPPKPPLPALPSRARSSMSTGSRLASSPVISSNSLSQPSSSTPVPPTSASLQPSSGTGRSSSAAPMPAVKAEPRRTSSIPPPPAPARPTTPPRSRPVTPPPARPITPPRSRQHKTPPPPSPSRAALLNMLSNDGKMSPELARKLADNTFLLKLWKSVPAAKALVNGYAAGPDASPGAGPSTAGVAVAANGHSGVGPHGPSALGRNGMTPANPARNAREGSPTPRQADVCCNCGSVKSDQWMTKKVKDGTPKKVCNPCGIYFNKHKRMRPRDLWETNASSPAVPSAPTASHHTRSHSLAGTPATVASTSHAQSQQLSVRSPNPNTSQFNPHLPVRSSPRLHRGERPERSLAADIFESPRKKQKTRHMPPSPRMATRASARTDDGALHGPDGSDVSHGSQPTPGAGAIASDGPHPSSFAFSPMTASLFGTSPAVADDADVDIDALLAQFTESTGATATEHTGLHATGATGMHTSNIAQLPALDAEVFAGLGNLEGISLEQLASLDNDPVIMELLATIEREQAEGAAAGGAAVAAGTEVSGPSAA